MEADGADEPSREDLEAAAAEWMRRRAAMDARPRVPKFPPITRTARAGAERTAEAPRLPEPPDIIA
jgi:hypothetical protein